MTVSNEIAIKLIGAGIVVDSEKEWVTPHFKDNSICLTKQCYLENIDNFMAITFPAPNSDELLAVLPEYITNNMADNNRGDYSLSINRSEGYYFPEYISGDYCSHEEVCDKSLSNALALLALKLAESGLLNKDNDQ
jgi:hypothetical protein